MVKIAIMVENSRAYGRAMIEGIAAYAQETRDWVLRPLTVEDAYTPRLRDFDGVIARIADDRLADRLARTGLPVVDVFCQKVRSGIAGVDSDHRRIGEMARDFFRSRGFANTAYCGIPGAAFSDARGSAFSTDATFVYSARTRKLPDESQFYAERADHIPDIRQLRGWVRELPRPIAVFCCNDLRAIQLQQVARGLGLRIPEDMAILGVDDDTILCSFAEIPTSSIDPNSHRVGYDAARLLRAMMHRKVAKKPHKIRYVRPGHLIERTSTEFMPVDPPWLGNALLHIERNMRRPIAASEIFALSGRSSTFVESVFREKLHTSVQAYITAVKMREARRLIADPSLRISEIAYQCGFSTPQYFCRTFTAAFGMNPKACRAGLQRSGKDSASPLAGRMSARRPFFAFGLT